MVTHQPGLATATIIIAGGITTDTDAELTAWTHGVLEGTVLLENDMPV